MQVSLEQMFIGHPAGTTVYLVKDSYVLLEEGNPDDRAIIYDRLDNSVHSGTSKFQKDSYESSSKQGDKIKLF